jgi:hypothetical protein
VRSDHLACAHCGGIVSEGNCQVCRVTRAQLDRERFSVPAPIIALVVLLVTLMLAYVAHQTA